MKGKSSFLEHYWFLHAKAKPTTGSNLHAACIFCDFLACLCRHQENSSARKFNCLLGIGCSKNLCLKCKLILQAILGKNYIRITQFPKTAPYYGKLSWTTSAEAPQRGQMVIHTTVNSCSQHKRKLNKQKSRKPICYTQCSEIFYRQVYVTLTTRIGMDTNWWQGVTFYPSLGSITAKTEQTKKNRSVPIQRAAS